jgi:adenosylcobinamide-GDP ribazoletransferase
MNLKALLLAFSFLTRLPVPALDEEPDEKTQGKSVIYYPLVGLAIGLILLLCQQFLAGVAPGLQAAMLLVVWVGITGALHLDGLADLADGWIGGQGSMERALEIMKDPRSGPAGVAVLVLLLLLKFAALEALIASGLDSAILLVPMIGRVALVASLIYLPYVRPEGLGASMARALPKDQARLVMLGSALLCLLFWGWVAFLVAGACAFVFVVLRQGLMGRLGGVTGDGAGAICELLEAVALVALVLV